MQWLTATQSGGEWEGIRRKREGEEGGVRTDMEDTMPQTHPPFVHNF